MKNKKNISAPKRGMNRDTSGEQLKNTDYVLGVNVTTSNDAGNSLNIQLEPSNYYAISFPDSYKVIGEVVDLIANKTYFFLTSITQNTNSPDFKRSSIGFVDNGSIYDINYNNEETTDLNLDCDGCGRKAFNALVTPLETVTQVPSLQYIELINDKCLDVYEGLNFDINFPAKKIEINQEKLGTTLYWNDYRNPPRYINVTDLEERGDENYLFEINDPCEDITYGNCIDVDKLLIFPKYNRMILNPVEQQLGGNLKKGTYEFWGAYCDLMGNEMTQYSTPTNPISIFDENNNILSQTETDEFTNFAIKIKVDNLDTRHFKYYKIAVVERNNIVNTQSVFLAGIYPTTDDTVVYTHSGSSNDDIYIARGNVSIKKRMDFNTLNAIKPSWEKAKFTMVSGDTLWHGGLVQEEELNIQPVMNLFGALLHWETSAASENLYKNAIATSKYKSYPRNEVQPFGIRLLYKNGGYSTTIPLIGRPQLTGEDDTLTGDTNLNSVVNNSSPCVTNDRNKKWQIYNTAVSYDEVCTDIEDSSTVSVEDIYKTCIIEDVYTIADNFVVISTENDFVDLPTYIKENPDDPNIAIITNAINGVYPGNCTPSYIGECQSPTLQVEYNVIGEINNEVDEYIQELDEANYLPSIPPSICNKYKRTDDVISYVEDTEFMIDFMGCFSGAHRKVYVRDSNFYNETCGYADTLINQEDPIQPGLTVFLNYAGSIVEADLLQIGWDVDPTTIVGDFKNKLHKKAQFFKAEKNGRDELILEITKQTVCSGDIDQLPTVDEVRYTFYTSCAAHTSGSGDVLGGGIVDLNSGLIKIIDVTTFPETFIVAIDAPIIAEVIDHSCDLIPGLTELVYKVVPPCGCFSVYTRDIENTGLKISWDNITINKVQEYQAECTFYIPRVNDCEPIPYKKGIMAYWESTETYDDNKQLWDSSEIIIKGDDLALLSSTDRDEFLNYYTSGLDGNGNYILKNADFRCQPIRHSKFPDNTVAPYIIDNVNYSKEATSIIFPLGVELDSAVVKTAINLAYINKLITKKQRDNIQGYEILKGDNSISKSVIANGIAFDVYNYEKNGDKIHFSNFPFNDLGQNKYCLTEPRGSLIDHPFDSERNYLYTFLSPDIFLTRSTIPDEVSLQGFVMGTTSSEFTAVDEHSEWTVMGQKSRRTSERLAIAEVSLEFIIKTGELLHNQWFVGGVGSVGGSIGGLIAAGIAITGMAISNGINIGKYRYDWLKTFRDLGRTYNFANFQTASANYNKFLKVDQYSDNYLRKLTIKKYLKDGDFTLVDENDGKQIKVNNWLREASAFLSTGELYPFDYSANTEYTSYDNNKKSIDTSSNFVSSETGCKENVKFQRNAASPYFTLKNYIPDQWGRVDSIKWLTTNHIFDLDEATACKPIFGGTFVISRFSWRRKTPIFRKDAIGLADKLPFMYSRYDNIGYPRFYCNYELDDGDNMYKGFLGLPYPDINSETAFDCETGRDSMYYKPPSKFYTSVHGVVDFLVESEINCNFRYAKNAPKDNFYPQNPNLSSWLQQTNLPMSEPNSFFYNNTYSFNVSNSPYKFLDKTYDKEVWRKRNLQKNAVTWSQKEVNENDLTNPWLVYKPLNWKEFKTNNGRLIDMHAIESDQFLARFENRTILLNSVDSLAERLNPQNIQTGVGGMFSQRLVESRSSDLGFNGTQHTDIVSSPYGHFSIDAMRGKILKIDQNGQVSDIISEQVGNQPTNMKQWFREHLPMKILKQLPEIDIDNKYKGIGYNMWYDDRESRLFITKRDYIVKDINCLAYDEEIGLYDSCGEDVITCPDGYTYNSLTELCEKQVISAPLCPEGYTYDELAQTCTLITVSEAVCEAQSFKLFPINMTTISDLIIEFNTGNMSVDWGDGMVQNYLTPSATSLNHTYSSPFTGEIVITVDNLNYVKRLDGASYGVGTYIEIRTSEIQKLTSLENLGTRNSGKNILVGVISELPRSLKQTYASTSNMSGNISDMPPISTSFVINGVNTITGNISSIVATTQTFVINGANTITGNINTLKPALEVFSLYGNNTIAGDISDIPTNMISFTAWGNNTISSYTPGRIWTNGMVEFQSRPISGGLNSSQVDSLLIDLASATWATTPNRINLTGTNQPRTPASDAAVIILQGSLDNTITPTGKKVLVYTN